MDIHLCVFAVQRLSVYHIDEFKKAPAASSNKLLPIILINFASFA